MVEASKGAVEKAEAVVLVDQKVLVKSRVLRASLYLHCHHCAWRAMVEMQTKSSSLSEKLKSSPLEEPADDQHTSSGFQRRKAYELPLTENTFIYISFGGGVIHLKSGSPMSLVFAN